MTDTAVVLSTIFVAVAFVALTVWFYVRGQHTRSGRAFETFVGRVFIAMFLFAFVFQLFRSVGGYLSVHPGAKTIAWSTVAAFLALALATFFISLARRFWRFFWYAAAAVSALVAWSWVAAVILVGFCLVIELILAIHHLASTIERSKATGT